MRKLMTVMAMLALLVFIGCKPETKEPEKAKTEETVKADEKKADKPAKKADEKKADKPAKKAAEAPVEK